MKKSHFENTSYAEDCIMMSKVIGGFFLVMVSFVLLMVSIIATLSGSYLMLVIIPMAFMSLVLSIVWLFRFLANV